MKHELLFLTMAAVCLLRRTRFARRQKTSAFASKLLFCCCCLLLLLLSLLLRLLRLLLCLLLLLERHWFLFCTLEDMTVVVISVGSTLVTIIPFLRLCIFENLYPPSTIVLSLSLLLVIFNNCVSCIAVIMRSLYFIVL